MKKLNLLLALFIGLTIVSCSSEDEPAVSNANELISITKDIYIRNNTNIYASSKFNFDNNKLIDIQHLDGSYDKIDYEGNVIFEILEFDANDNLEWTTTYTYDSSKRLTRKKVVPSLTNPNEDVSRQKDIVYGGSEIQSEISWSDNGLSKNTISINPENFITEDKSYGANDMLTSSFIFNYSNENLSKVIHKDHEGTTEFEVTYTYLDKIASGSYCYKKYLFGDEWKNNSSFDKQSGLGHSDSYEISKNYIKDISFSYVGPALNFSSTETFEYEFDAEDRIIKQTRNGSDSTGETFIAITTFEYQQ